MPCWLAATEVSHLARLPPAMAALPGHPRCRYTLAGCPQCCCTHPAGMLGAYNCLFVLSLMYVSITLTAAAPLLQAAQVAPGAALLQVPLLLHLSPCRTASKGDHERLSAQMLALSPFMPCCSEELPPPPRRDRLPKPQQVEKSVGLWSIIKECVGKDLTRVCLPVFFNEPLSALQKSAEDLEYAELLDKVRVPAVECRGGKSARFCGTVMGKEATRYCTAPGTCSCWK